MNHATPLRTGSRLALIFMVTLASALGALLIAPDAAGPLVFTFITDGVRALVWCVACYGFGRAITQHADLGEGVLNAVSRIAMGIGVLGTLVFLLGSVGVLNQIVAIALIIAGILLAIPARLALAEYLKQRPSAQAWVFLVVSPVFSMLVVGASVLPGVLWGDEPHGYDVLSYHLQMPREWLDAGAIHTLPHNIFSYFPLLVEMHFLLAMQSYGDAYAGMYLAQYLHATMWLLTLLAAFGGARAIGASGAVATLAFASIPFGVMLGAVAYNECGMTLFTTLMVVHLVRMLRIRSEVELGVSHRAEKAVASSTLLTVGLLAGFAIACKYTAIPFAVCVIGITIVVWSIRSPRFLPRLLLMTTLGAALGASPWLVRNVIATGNPVFPLALTVFGQGPFDAKQAARFEIAHSPRDDQKSFVARIKAVDQSVLQEWRYASASALLAEPAVDQTQPAPSSANFPAIVTRWVSRFVPVIGLFVVACAIVVWRRESRQVTFVLVAITLAGLFVWMTSTHLQARFLFHLFPLLAIAIALPPNGMWRATASLVILIGAIGAYPQVVTRLANVQPAVGLQRPRALLSQYLPSDVAQVVYETNRPIVLVGDAKAFWFDIDSRRLHYQTVFDVGSNGDWLGRRGEQISKDAVFIVDPNEIRRFVRTYRNLPALPSFAIEKDNIFIFEGDK